MRTIRGSTTAAAGAPAVTLNDLKTAWREPGEARLPDSPAARDAGRAPALAPVPADSPQPTPNPTRP